MKRNLIKLLSGIAVVTFVTSAYGLTIVPIFDSSITNDPNGALMVAAINQAIGVLQSNILDNQTVIIHFTNDPTVGLGQSSTYGNTYSYPAYLAALKSHASSVNDTNGLSKIPNTGTDPLLGGTNIYMPMPLAVLMGLDSGYGGDGTDSTIALKMSLMNFTRPPLDPDKYDLSQVAQHEMDEVLGTPSSLAPVPTVISPIDLFRYTTNLTRTYTTNGDNAYFSVDGTNLWARYNMDPGGDYSDWWSVYYPTNWSPLTGDTLYFAQVQDAFSGPGTMLDQGTNELAMLDVIGWTLTTHSSTPVTRPTLKIVNNGPGHFMLSWSNTVSGLALEEKTNLNGSWVASASGATNPIVLAAGGAHKYYRLYQPTNQTPSLLSLPPLAPKSTNLQVRVHVSNPRPF